MVDFTRDAPAPVDLDVDWIHGAPPSWGATDPPIQVHACDPHTYVLRQSKHVSYEAPFLYLLFGHQRAVLFDTGATKDDVGFPLRSTVDGIVDRWSAENAADRYELVIAHTHSHGDHVAGDAQFADRPNTVVVGHGRDDVQAFFDITEWPGQVVPFDLGGRVLQIFATPGHHRASIAVYDPWSELLLTGDTVYPGRLYVEDFRAFLDSLDRLIAFTETHPIRAVMGCHVEMTQTPGRDYPIGTKYQPQEAPLPMTVAQLRAVRDAASAVADQPGAHQFDDFAIFHGPCRTAMARQVARTLVGRFRR